MKTAKLFFLSLTILAGTSQLASAQDGPRWFLGLGGGANLGFNGHSFVSRSESGIGAGAGVDAYVGVMTRPNRVGFGIGVQGFSISDRYTDFGRQTYWYPHGNVYFRVADFFVPYIHMGAAYTNAFSPAGGLGIMMPIRISSRVSIVPNVKLSALKGSLLGGDNKVGMVASASLGLRINLGRAGRAKQMVQPFVEPAAGVPPVQETVVVHDTVKVVERIIEKEAPAVSETVKAYEQHVNRELATVVLFETGSYKLSPVASSILNDIVVFLSQNPDLQIFVEGHTDDVGAEDMNLKLSRNRAAAVTDYLISHGANPTRVSSVGYGETLPIVPNNSAANRQMNRRVEVHFSPAASN